MPRPKKYRRVCGKPRSSGFAPLCGCASQPQSVVMTVDEYEVVRLLDLENLTQEEAALRMDVARTTVTGIYNTARKKLADCIVNGKILLITGGDYKICEAEATCNCPCKGKYCPKYDKTIQILDGVKNENSGNV